MAVEQKRAENLWERLKQAWWRLPIGGKLLIPALAVFGLVLFGYLFFIVPTLNQVIDDNVRVAFDTRLNQLDSRITALLEDARLTMVNLASSFEAREFVRYHQDNNPERIAAVQPDLEARMTNAFTAPRLQFANMRFLNAAGDQLIRVRVSGPQVGVPGLVMGKESLQSETSAPFYPELIRLTPGEFYISQPYLAEPVGRPGEQTDLEFQIASPVWYNDQYAGVIVASFRPRVQFIDIFQTPASEVLNFRSYLLSTSGIVLVSADTLVTPSLSVYGDTGAQNPSLPTAINQNRGDIPLTENNNVTYLVKSFGNLRSKGYSGLDWRLLIIAESSGEAGVFRNLIGDVAVRIMIIALGTVLLIILIGQSIVRPIRRLSQGAQRFAEGELQSKITIDSQDEIGQLATTLNSMSTHLLESLTTLESRVQERTRNIQIAADISRDAATIRDIDTLLQNTVNSIQERFGFYHAQVFLLDEAGKNAVLITSTGEAGKTLLKMGHKLAVGSQSIIGQVTEKRRSFVTLDTQKSEVPHRFNPILPLTRSEIALPLIVGEKLIGAMDIQSTEPDAFNDEDVKILQILADQIAVAIDNASLIEAQRKQVEEINALNRQLTREAWQDYSQHEAKTGLAYRYDLREVKAEEYNPVDGDGGNGKSETQPKRAVEAPIVVRGEVIGALNVVEDELVPFTGDDRAMIRAVADRVALAIENVRLVEQTQNALKRIQELYETTKALSTADALDRIYTTAAERLESFPSVEYIILYAAHPNPVKQTAFLRVAYVWQRNPVQNPVFVVGNYLPRDFFSEILNADMSAPREFTSPEEAFGHSVPRQVFVALGVHSVAAMPLTTASRFFGVLACYSKRQGGFGEQFMGFLGALGDQMANAIENRWLFDQSEAEAQRNRALAEAAQVAGQVGIPYERRIRALVETVSTSAGIDRWWYGEVIADVDSVKLFRVASAFPTDSPLHELVEVDLNTANSPLAESARQGEVVIVNNPSDSPLMWGLPSKVALAYGKHIALPVRSGANTVGVLMIGRDVATGDITDRDAQLGAAVASQIAVASENRRLFSLAENERSTLETILNSLPTGVVVVDSEGRTTLTNEQARVLLGLDAPAPYKLLHTDTNAEYTPDELPLNRVLQTGAPVFAEDLVIVSPEGERANILVNAAPITRDGTLISAVAVFQDVTELRELENVLQESLRETTTLYEISRTIAAENDLSSILKVVATQLHTLLTPDELFAVFTETTNTPLQSYSLGVNEDGSYAILIGSHYPVPKTILLDDDVAEEINITLNPALAQDEALQQRGIKALVSIPLNARSRVVGWLVALFRNPRTLTAEERRTLSNIADQTAVAGESARLAEQTSAALTTATLLYEASSSVNSADSIESALAAIRDQLVFFNPTLVDIFMVSPDEDRAADWVVEWVHEDPDHEGTVILEGAPKLENFAFLESDSYFVDDVNDALPSLVEVMKLHPKWGQFRAQASIPMSKGRLMGRIVISFEQPYHFGRTEQQVITSIADQGVITIDNFLLVKQTQESLDETAILYQSSRAISNATTPEEQINAIVDYAVQPIVSLALMIRLLGDSWDAPDASLRVIAEWSSAETISGLEGVRFTPDQFPGWADLSAGQVLWAEDLDDPDKAIVADPNFYFTFGLKSVLVLPLISSGRPVGALILGSDQVWDYSERELRVYASVADLVAISMERQRLLEQTDKRARQLQLTAQIAGAAASILNLKELFDQTVNLIKDGFAYDHVQIFRIMDEGKHARVIASTGEAGKRLLEIGHYLPVGSRSVIGRVTETGEAQIVADTTDPRSVHRPNPFLPNTRAEMALALVARNRILGALDVQSNEPGAFTADDVAVLSSLANQIAIAIDNAELFETSNQRADEMRFLFDVTNVAAGSAQDPEQAFQSVSELILEQYSAAVALTLLLDTATSRLIPYAAHDPSLKPSIPAFFDYNPVTFQVLVDQRDPIIVNDVSTARVRMQTMPRLGLGRVVQTFSAILPEANSMLIAPLLTGESLSGLVLVLKHELNSFSEEGLPLAQTMVTSLSSAVQTMRSVREVQQANVRLLELDKVKNQFLANMSHELRTPLNSIIGFSRVILKGIDGPLTDMQQSDLTTIYESGKHLLGLVNDILDQAKIEADRMEFTYSHFSMIDLIRGVMSTAVGLVKDKPIRLHQEIEPDLPLVWGDEFRTRQALLNLVSNAAKFTNQGNITASAFTIEEKGTHFVQVSVTDTGIGIPPDKLDLVFEPFRQAENTAARQYEGTGLGLPISKKLIEKQGGRLWVTSETGLGSTFSFTIPVNPQEDLQQQEPPAAAE